MTRLFERQHNPHVVSWDGAGVFFVSALAFATGILIGVAAGILVAPHSGAYTRRQLQNLAEDVTERAASLAADAKEAIENAVEQGKRIVS